MDWTPEKIRELRGQLSRSEFARILGVMPSTVRYWELDNPYASKRYRCMKMLDDFQAGKRKEYCLNYKETSDILGALVHAKARFIERNINGASTQRLDKGIETIVKAIDKTLGV